MTTALLPDELVATQEDAHDNNDFIPEDANESEVCDNFTQACLAPSLRFVSVRLRSCVTCVVLFNTAALLATAYGAQRDEQRRTMVHAPAR